MKLRSPTSNVRPATDPVLVNITDYVLDYQVSSEKAIDTARLCMTDTPAGALDALDYLECTKLVGPTVPGTVVPHGARVLKDGSSTPKVEIEYPVGHQRRRAESIPVLRAKFEASLARRFPQKQRERILKLCDDARALDGTPVNEFVDLLVGDLPKSRLILKH